MQHVTHDVVYRETTPFPWWARLIMWGSLGGTALGMLFDWGRDGPELPRILGALGVVGLGVALEAVVGGLLVEVRRTELFFGLGRAILLRKRIPYEEIERLEPVTYRPLREFGGWGLRGFGARQAWTARGDQAVVLHLVNGREIYLGSDNPPRLAERIRAVAGDRLGRAAADWT